jgi:hypothetical protein
MVGGGSARREPKEGRKRGVTGARRSAEEGCALRVVGRARGCIAKARRKERVRRRVGVRDTRTRDAEWKRVAAMIEEGDKEG